MKAKPPFRLIIISQYNTFFFNNRQAIMGIIPSNQTRISPSTIQAIRIKDKTQYQLTTYFSDATYLLLDLLLRLLRQLLQLLIHTASDCTCFVIYMYVWYPILHLQDKGTKNHSPIRIISIHPIISYSHRTQLQLQLQQQQQWVVAVAVRKSSCSCRSSHSRSCKSSSRSKKSPPLCAFRIRVPEIVQYKQSLLHSLFLPHKKTVRLNRYQISEPTQTHFSSPEKEPSNGPSLISGLLQQNQLSELTWYGHPFMV